MSIVYQFIGLIHRKLHGPGFNRLANEKVVIVQNGRELYERLLLDLAFNLVEVHVASRHESFSVFEGGFGFADELSLEDEGGLGGDDPVHPELGPFQAEVYFGIIGSHVQNV